MKRELDLFLIENLEVNIIIIFIDATSEAEGKIQAMVVFKTFEKTTYFEKLSVFLDKPETKTFRIIQFSVDDEKEEIYPKDTPRGTQRSRSADRDTHSQH